MRKSHLDGWFRPDLISETPAKVALTRLTLERLDSETIFFLNTIVVSIPRTGITSAKRYSSCPKVNLRPPFDSSPQSLAIQKA